MLLPSVPSRSSRIDSALRVRSLPKPFRLLQQKGGDGDNTLRSHVSRDLGSVTLSRIKRIERGRTVTDGSSHELGKPVSHAFAKELLAGIAGAEVDKLAETKGADWVDREKAKRHAKANVERMYDEQYGQQDQYDP